MNRVRVLVADSVPIYLAGVRNLLTGESDFDVLEAADLDRLTVMIQRACPDIALVDLDLPPDGGVAAVTRLARECQTAMIVWSFDPTRETVLAALRAGASGYLHKEISPLGLVRSLRGVARGEAPLARDLATLMIDAFHVLEERAAARERASVLSLREREVLSLVAYGARNREIAGSLFISEFTVKRHVQNILQKLELPSRRAAATLYYSAYGADGAAAVAEPA